MTRVSVLLFVLLAACKGNPTSSSSPPTPTPAPTPTEKSMVPGDTTSDVGAPGTQDLAGLGNILQQVQTEAQSRPPTAITAEKVFDGLTAAGIKLATKKQVLAHNVGANYCALAKVFDDKGAQRGIVVCEYGSAKEATTANADLTKNPKFPSTKIEREVRDATTIAVINDLDGSLTPSVMKVFQTL